MIVIRLCFGELIVLIKGGFVVFVADSVLNDFLRVVIIVQDVVPLINPSRLPRLRLIIDEPINLRQLLLEVFSCCVVFQH